MEFDSKRVISPRMSYLLVTIVVLMVYLLEEVETDIPAMKFIFAFVILATIYVAGTQRNWLIIAIVLAIPTLALSASSNLNSWPPNDLLFLYLVSLALFVGFAIVAVLREILLADRVTIHTISGALVVYLLLGLFWTILYFFVEGQSPGSYSFTKDLTVSEYVSMDIFSNLAYFSLITITSVGYGDITPIGEHARTLATMEAVVGQVFLAVLVAWLVGKYLSHSIDQK